MPRYFTDTDDGILSAVDDEGIEFASVSNAREAALKALPEMAHDAFRRYGSQEFSVCVRDDAGRDVYRAVLTLKEDWADGAELPKGDGAPP